MPRMFSKKIRKVTRKKKPVILFIAEGKNVTESQYFTSFQKQHNGFSIQILTTDHSTDPKRLFQKITRYWKDKELDEKQGDIGFIVLDLDCNSDKANLIRELSKKNSFIKFIVSNPCFEVWFLLHFKYTTHTYASSSETVRALRNYISNYEKNMSVAEAIADKLENAMTNAGKLKKYFEEIGAEWPSEMCNPCTDVPIVIDVFNKYNNNEKKKGKD
jgi:hypothetical protein